MCRSVGPLALTLSPSSTKSADFFSFHEMWVLADRLLMDSIGAMKTIITVYMEGFWNGSMFFQRRHDFDDVCRCLRACGMSVSCASTVQRQLVAAKSG